MPDEPGRGSTFRDGVSAVGGSILGLAPHVLHHIGLLAGTAIVAGTAGNVLFFVVGLILSVPLLRRLYRRFGSWVAPALGVAVFTGMFVLSAFVLGPTLFGGSSPETPAQTPAPSQSHGGHHS